MTIKVGDMITKLAAPIENTKYDPNYGKRRSFFVVGSEGSGTYMLAEALVATCEVGYNSKLEKDPIDPKIFDDFDGHIVIRRSIPHANTMPPLHGIINVLVSVFVEVNVIFVIREPNASAKSVLRRASSGTPYWQPDMRIGLSYIGGVTERKDITFTYLTYEAFCLSEGFRRWLFEERLQLPYPEDFEIKYGNDKHYE